MSMTRKIIAGAAWSAFETWGRQLALFAVFIILARYLGPEAFGLATLAMVIPNILCVPVMKGIPEALIQRKEIDADHLNSAFWFLTAIGASLSAIIWACSGLVAALFDQPEIADLIRWASAIVIVQAIGAVPGAYLKRELQFRLFALRTLTGTITGGAVGVTMAIAGYGMWSIVAMQLSRAAVETTVILVGSTWKPGFRYSHGHVRQLLPFATPIIIQSFLSLANNELPKFILGLFIGPTAVGIYAFARRPLDLLNDAFIGPLVTVTMPAVARFQSQPDKIDAFFNASIRATGVIGFPAFIGFAAIAPVAVPLIFGDQWLDAIVVLQIIMLLGAQRTIDSICVYTILALGHSRLILAFDIAYTVIASSLMIIAAQFNLETVTAALVAANLILLPAFLYFARKIANIDVLRPLAIYPRLALAAAFMFAAVTTWFARAPAGISQEAMLALSIAFGAAVYISSAAILLRRVLLEAIELIRKRQPKAPAPSQELG